MKRLITLAFLAACAAPVALGACGSSSSGGSGGTSGSAGSGGTSGSGGSGGTTSGGSGGTSGSAGSGGTDGGAKPAQVVDCASATVAQTIAATGQIGAYKFSPADATVNAGDTIKFDNQTQVPHTATSGSNSTPDGKWDTGTIQPGQSVCVKFLMSGSYPYFCQFHPTLMTGTVTVN